MINQQRALWKESPQNLTKEDYLEFYRYLYPFQEEPQKMGLKGEHQVKLSIPEQVQVPT